MCVEINCLNTDYIHSLRIKKTECQENSFIPFEIEQLVPVMTGITELKYSVCMVVLMRV